MDKVLHGVKDGFSVDVVFLDLAKAFDKVPHKRLLEKPSKHGRRAKLLNVIGNWLSNRKQRVFETIVMDQVIEFLLSSIKGLSLIHI